MQPFPPAFVLAVAFSFVALAADAPGGLTEEERVKLVGKWQTQYKAELTARAEAWDKARAKSIADPKSLSARNASQIARDSLYALKADPLSLNTIDNFPKVGEIGRLLGYSGAVGKIGPSGTLVVVSYSVPTELLAPDGTFIPSKDTKTKEYIVLDPLPKAKTGAKINLPTGLYHVVRIDTIDRRKTAVVQHVEIKKDEMPKKGELPKKGEMPKK